MGPFNTPLYRVCTLNEAFNSRFNSLKEAVKSQLLPKREQLTSQMVRLDYRLDEVNTAYNVINRDIQMEYQAVHGRLEHAYKKKVALLHHELDAI